MAWEILRSVSMDLLHKSHNPPVQYPTMHHFVKKMCTRAHFCYKMMHGRIFIWCIVGFTGWETSARPLANASENLAGRVEICIGYIGDYPVRASAKKFFVSQPDLWDGSIIHHVSRKIFGNKFLIHVWNNNLMDHFLCQDFQQFLLAYSEREDKQSLEWDFETIHNIHMWGCEFAPNAREGMRSWNMSVQFWLASHVYRRVPLKALRWVDLSSLYVVEHALLPCKFLPIYRCHFTSIGIPIIKVRPSHDNLIFTMGLPIQWNHFENTASQGGLNWEVVSHEIFQ